MPLSATEIIQNVDKIFSLYDKYGNEDYGENVTQLMHMVQSANYAKEEGANDELVLAAFLHDIGHFIESESMDIYGKQHHDKLGGHYLLNLGFPERMAKLVSSHVDAKRYLTYKHSDYYDQLSVASKMTLEFQGGPMDTTEAAAFEADPFQELYIKIRHWDDLGKDQDVPVAEEDINQLKALMITYLIQQ